MASPDRGVAPTGFDGLLAAHPWPPEPPFPDVAPTGRVPRGLELALDLLSQAPTQGKTVMEIGAELGGSTRAFLAVPGTRVVSVDPWKHGKKFKDFPELRGMRGEHDAALRLFQSFNYEYKDRLVALRGYSPAGPVEVHDSGLPVDLVYIDGDHTYDAVITDLEICAALFPDATLTGDDWLFKALNRPGYEGLLLPVQTAVRRWAQRRDYAIVTQSNTWLIDPSRHYNLDRLPLLVPSPVKAQRASPTAQTHEAEPARRRAGRLSRRLVGRLRRAVSARRQARP